MPTGLNQEKRPPPPAAGGAGGGVAATACEAAGCPAAVAPSAALVRWRAARAAAAGVKPRAGRSFAGVDAARSAEPDSSALALVSDSGVGEGRGAGRRTADDSSDEVVMAAVLVAAPCAAVVAPPIGGKARGAATAAAVPSNGPLSGPIIWAPVPRLMRPGSGSRGNAAVSSRSVAEVPACPEDAPGTAIRAAASPFAPAFDAPTRLVGASGAGRAAVSAGGIGASEGSPDAGRRASSLDCGTAGSPSLSSAARRPISSASARVSPASRRAAWSVA